MTNERAIELLHRISDSQFDGIHGDERREALEMAVRALEGDGDMISRQAVMKEFSDFVRESNNSDFAPTPTWNDAVSLVGSMPSAQPEQRPLTEDDYAYCEECDHVEMCRWYPMYGCEFKGRPSAQPEWIPCSERLPEKKQSLLVTVADGVSPYTSDDEWTGTGFWAYGKRVSAWMPLPKPYGGESE